MRQVVVITGASDGIGAEMARQLAAKHGKEVALVLAARNEVSLKVVGRVCADLGTEVMVVRTDVTIQDDCRRLIDATIGKFGRIDVLINNAGKSAQALFEDVEDLSWYEDLMKVNLWGAVYCTHAALRHLRASKGRIVAVSSLAGLVGVPGRTAYGASKFAMSGFFEALRAEVKSGGVSVTLAYPGVVATQIRYRGYNAKGEAAGTSGLREESAMSVKECARLILAGAEARKREVVMTGRGKFGRFLKLIAPGMIENMALKALKSDVRPR